MIITILREPSMAGATMGSLYLDGVWQCWTLEDMERPSKVLGQTAIPVGEYRLSLTMSPRFKTALPELHEVPGFTGIRIHSGNTTAHTEGCILVGLTRDTAFIGRSQAALSLLLTRLRVSQDETHTCVIRRVLG
jgi:hypothetical protein